ncbi:MAG: DNA repair protein RecN [bacterium]|nr:DNA repair protein RecN [bacterium]
MLESIAIENIAVIEKVVIEFGDKFNVLTGETGAGKSIIIDSLNAVLGAKTTREIIRTGCEKASVVAEFSDIPNEVSVLLDEYGIDNDEVLILQRVINADGKNVCRVNGCPVNLSVLKEISHHLFNIHGQHDNQNLLKSDKHIYFLDAFDDNSDLLSDYFIYFSKLKDIRKELRQLETDTANKERILDLLNYEINEIESVGLKLGERDSLIDKKNKLVNSERVKRALATVRFAINGDESHLGALSDIRVAAEQLSSFVDISDEIKTLYNELLSTVYNLDAVGSKLRSLSDDFDFDAGSLSEIDERLTNINHLIYKYGGDEQSVLDYLENAKNKLSNLRFSEERINQLLLEQTEVEEEVYKRGLRLTESRKKAGERFCKEVCDVLKYLEMPNVVLSIDFTQGSYTAIGCDRVEMLISTNVGEPAKPLSKIASGGELSRIMLAIKSVLADKDNVKTLIFDEIDSGISGRAAEKVARQLRKLSGTHQIICVTHLAQIAAAGHTHFLIEKGAHNGRTYTSVNKIVDADRINEIGRIISGSVISDNIYNTAKELIESID